MIYQLLIMVSFLYGIYSLLLVNENIEYFLILLIVIANILLLYSYYYLSLATKIKSWESDIGSVQKVSVEEEIHFEDTGKIILYYPKIQYKYTVKSKDYFSELISFDQSSIKYKDADELKDFLNTLISKNSINVYYNPKKPSRSVVIRDLSKKRHQHFVVLFISGLIIIGVELFVKILFLK